MSATEEQPKLAKVPPHQSPHEAGITAEVLRRLGRPERLSVVQVRQLWRGHCRVNVVVEAGICFLIAHSFFLKIGEAGEIVTSSPAIRRMY